MEPPLKPNESDCCNSGCNPCIFDVYEEQLKKYLNQEPNHTDVKNCISQTAYTTFRLVGIEPHAQNTFIYTFEHINAKNNLHLFYKPGQHFLIKAPRNATNFTRAYTPIPTEKVDQLTFTIVIKLYKDGAMSNFFRKLKVNDDTLWRGPYGDYNINYNLGHMLLIAQGTGVAPLYAIIHKIIQNERCETFLHLFLCCRMEDDIPLRNELYHLSSYWNFSYEIFLSQATDVKCKYNETIHLFKLSSNNIKSYINNISVDNKQVLICGSEMFNKDISRAVLDCNVDSTKIVPF